MEKKNQCSEYMRVSAVGEVFREYLSNLYAHMCPVLMSTEQVLIEYLSKLSLWLFISVKVPLFRELIIFQLLHRLMKQLNSKKIFCHKWFTIPTGNNAIHFILHQLDWPFQGVGQKEKHFSSIMARKHLANSKPHH